MAQVRSARRRRGNIETLPSGALRVRVFAGRDPVTKRDHYLRELIPVGPHQRRNAEKALTRLQNQIDERRHPRTNATVGQLIDRYLNQHDGERSTLKTYRAYVEKHVCPLLGDLKVSAVDADVLDSFYAELRRCREHCTGRRKLEHRTPGKHACDDRCGPHQCEPLSASAVRQIHFVLSGAFQRAVRWHWLAVNPVPNAAPPSAKAPNPHPPTSEEAARIINAAWEDPDWGVFVWITMTTGSRRGEMCAVHWRHLDLKNGVLVLEKSIGQDGSETFEKDTKTHQRRHLVLDPETVSILSEHWERSQSRAEALGLILTGDGFVFSPEPDGTSHPKPSSISQRYRRLANRLGIETTLHALRHYSATELIAGGVDIRTVAGRLGHGGGGATTLRVYSAWISESDQRAAGNLLSRMPARPSPQADPIERAKTDPRNPYEVIASTIRARIIAGELSAGDPAPTLKQLATDHGVAVGTAHRAFELLKAWNLIEAGPGRRARVVASSEAELRVREALSLADAGEVGDEPAAALDLGRELLDLELVHCKTTVSKFSAEANPADPRQLRRLLVDAIQRHGDSDNHIGEYEMVVRCRGERGIVSNFVSSA